MSHEQELRQAAEAWAAAIVANDAEAIGRFMTDDWDEWTTDVFVRTAGGWKCAHTQITPAK